ncbi:MAG: tetratricopeptide repeat protein [Pseudonocardiales bacterium]
MSEGTPTPAEENRQELEALCRMLTRASGFRLGFVVANHPSLRSRIAQDCARACGLRPREITLDGQASDGIVAQLERAIGDDQPGALFVYGLESLLDLRLRQSPAMDLLNLNRDYCWGRFPWPVVFVAPLFAVREFARQAPDFWSGRTGVYRFTGDRDDITETLAGLGIDYDWSLTAGSKLERREILEHLQAELDNQPDEDPALTVELLSLLAQAAAFESDWPTQQRLLTRALPIYRQIGARLGEANAIKALGDVALRQARYEDAAEYYGQALPIYRQIGDRLGEAYAIQALGDVALRQDRYEDAAEYYGQALLIYHQIGDRLGEANTLLSRARLAIATGERASADTQMAEVIRIYTAIGLTEWADTFRAEAAGWESAGAGTPDAS